MPPKERNYTNGNEWKVQEWERERTHEEHERGDDGVALRRLGETCLDGEWCNGEACTYTCHGHESVERSVQEVYADRRRTYPFTRLSLF